MARVLDIILIGIFAALLVGSTLYKLIIWHRYRDDPAKREALISSGQVYPKWLTKFILDECDGTSTGKSWLPNQGHK